MDIEFKKNKLQKIFESQSELVRKYGDRNARTIMKRMGVLQSALCLADVPTTKPERRHQLTEDRDEQFAVDLVHPLRLVFSVQNDPIPRNPDSGINLKEVTAIEIIGVIDYH